MSRTMRLIDSRWGWLGWIFIPKNRRRAACEAEGTHRPVLIDMGRSKLCMRCGAW